MIRRIKSKEGNKKVKNATKCEYNGIKFKSSLELFCYKELEKLGIDPGYESFKDILLHGFIPRVNIFEPSKLSNDLTLNKGKIRDMTYTPDFHFKIWDKEEKTVKHIFIDTKGFANETYPLKKKLFLQSFQDGFADIYFFEPHNQRHVLQCIEIIKQL